MTEKDERVPCMLMRLGRKSGFFWNDFGPDLCFI